MKKLLLMLFLPGISFAGTITTSFSSIGTVTYSSGTAAAAAAFAKGFNFRATSGYVTDGTNETYVLDTDAYPTTRNGVTFGWTVDPNTIGGGARDRNSGLDRRLAGINFAGNQLSSTTFRVDLPSAGTYTIQVAFGDSGGNTANTYMDIRDGTTSLISFQPLPTAATPTFGDAAGATYSAAAWPGSETTVSKTFSTTQCNVWLGSGLASDGTNSVINHLFLTK